MPEANHRPQPKRKRYVEGPLDLPPRCGNLDSSPLADITAQILRPGFCPCYRLRPSSFPFAVSGVGRNWIEPVDVVCQ